MSAQPVRTFHIEACLGRGGFGEVYRAEMRRPGGFATRVALKLLRADVDARSQAVQRLRDEARMLGLVRHRAIPAIYDLVVLEGRPALVTAYVQGVDFGRAMRSDDAPSPRACVQVAAAVADALDAAYHAQVGDDIARIVHRDLKPANIRIAHDGTPMLLDFGIAFTDAVTRVAETQSSALVGSPAYMAPERFDGLPPAPANDVFGLGAVLFEALVGRRLFGDVSFKTLAAISLFEERYDRAIATRMAEVPRTLPEPLRQLLTETLAWSPAQRPTAHDVARALEAIAPTVQGETLESWARRRRGTPDRRIDAPWVGRTLVEGSHTASPSFAHAPVAAEDTPPTFDGLLDLEIPTATTDVVLPEVLPDTVQATEPPTSPQRTRIVVAIGAALLLMVGAAGFAGFFLPSPTPEPQGSAHDGIEVVPATLALPTSDDIPASSPSPSDVVEAPPPSETSKDPEAPTPAPEASPSPLKKTVRTPTRTPPPVLPRVDSLIGRDDDAPSIATIATPTAVRDAASTPKRRTSNPSTAPAPSKPATATAAPPEPQGAWVRAATGSKAERLTLVGDAGTFELPAKVPPGTYKLMATFQSGVPQFGCHVPVANGRDVEVRCANRMCGVVR